MKLAGLAIAASLVVLPAVAHADDARVLPETAVVHVVSDRNLIVEQLVRAPDGYAWTMVCPSPCDIPLLLGAYYRVAGKVFQLAGNADGRVEIRVDVRSKVPGVVMVSLGGGAVAGGLAAALAGGALAAEASVFGIPTPNTSGYFTAAAILGISGLALTGGGIASLARSGATVDQRAGEPTVADDRWLRVPERHSGTEIEAALPRVACASLFSIHFWLSIRFGGCVPGREWCERAAA
jgi:hypothetical protein